MEAYRKGVAGTVGKWRGMGWIERGVAVYYVRYRIGLRSMMKSAAVMALASAIGVCTYCTVHLLLLLTIMSIK